MCIKAEHKMTQKSVITFVYEWYSNFVDYIETEQVSDSEVKNDASGVVANKIHRATQKAS
jgi:hypothetical protein